MIVRLISILVAAFAMLFFARIGVVQAQASNIQIFLTAPTLQLHIGDVVPLELRVIYPNNHQILFPRLPVDWGDMEILRQHPPTISSGQDGTVTAIQRIDVTVFTFGTFETSEFDVTLRDASGQLVDIPVTPLTLEVVPALPEGEATLRDIRPQQSLNLTEIWPVAAATLGIVLVTSLLIFGIVKLVGVIKRRRARSVDERTPYEVARNELMALGVPSDEGEAMSAREQYAQVANSIRRYLEQTYQVPAFDLTTEELNTSLANTSVNYTNYQALVNLLAECDLAKFSLVVPEIDPEQGITTRALELLEVLSSATAPHVGNGAEVAQGQAR